MTQAQLEALAAALSGAGKGAQTGQQAEGQYLNSRDAVRAELYGVQQRAATDAATQALNTDKFTVGLPAQGASEAARGAMLQNVQDVGVDMGRNTRANVVNFTGGTRPSELTPEARAAGGALAAHGSALLADPNSFAKGTTAAALPAFDMSPEPKAGFWGQAAGVGGTLASILAALGKGGASGGGDITKKGLAAIAHALGFGGGGGFDDPEGGLGADVPPGDPNTPYVDGEGEGNPTGTVPITDAHMVGADASNNPMDGEPASVSDWWNMPEFGTPEMPQPPPDSLNDGIHWWENNA